MNYTILSQRDAKWRNKKLGNSNYTIGSHGCTITALTMWINRVIGLNLTPDQVNDRMKFVGGFSGGLILWKMIDRAFINAHFVWRNYNYWNPTVAWYVYVRKLPVLVEVNGAKIGAPKHWVLYIGYGKAVDPWTGKIISTSLYPATGYALIEKR